MEDLEVKFTTEVGTISCSPFDAIRTWVASAVEGNENLQVTEESLKSAKETLASYRKLKTSLEDERKRIKREWNRPYEEWEVQYKDAIAELDSTISDIAGKVKAVEDDQEAKRITSINDMILKDADDIRPGLADIVKDNPVLWANVCKPNYYNKTGSLIKNTEAWRAALLGISRDIDVISNSPDKEQLTINYMNLGDLALAIQKVEENKKRLAVLEQQRAAQEERNKRIQENTPIPDPEDIEPTIMKVPVPNERMVDAADLKAAKALRWIIGPRWKIKVLFKVAMTLGLTIANYEEKR